MRKFCEYDVHVHQIIFNRCGLSHTFGTQAWQGFANPCNQGTVSISTPSKGNYSISSYISSSKKIATHTIGTTWTPIKVSGSTTYKTITANTSAGYKTITATANACYKQITANTSAGYKKITPGSSGSYKQIKP